MPGACIAASGVVCPIGIGARQLAASFGAGLSRFSESPVLDPCFEPITMALLPEDALRPLDDVLAAAPLRARERRMLRLAAPALSQVVQEVPHSERLPIFLALPQRHPQSAHEPAGEHFLEHLAMQAELPLDTSASQRFDVGRAGGLLALRAGLDAIAGGRAQVIVGGVDSHLDLRLLAALGQESRILGPRVMDGFVPGEGAAFVLLSRQSPTAEGRSVVEAVGYAEDAGHRYSSEPARGEGLSHAIDALRVQLPSVSPARTCFAGFNGESFGAKEWGVARVRHTELLAADIAVEHPGDCFGDTGAAMAPLLLSLADEALRGGQRQGPMLVWASSDGPSCACAYLHGA